MPSPIVERHKDTGSPVPNRNSERERQATFFSIAVACLAIATALLSPRDVNAALISFTLEPANPSAQPGDAILFTGAITNLTGGLLESTDLSFSFAGFDPTVFTITQLLGMDPFQLPDLSVSPEVDLFSIAVAADAAPGLYWIDVLLLDSNNNVSDPVLVQFQVVPIGNPAFLLLSALVPLFLRYRKRSGASESAESYSHSN